MRHKETIAMILAGGQGSRLGALTNRIAKPGLPFGGKYKIIDFALSNCANSGITTVGVLTQYQPLELNTYIASGQPWDMDRLNGGVYILPPYIRGQRGEWYKGTANAIYQNMRFIEQFAPENVIVLSGDHIYTMDYRLMRSFHKKSGAALTIAVIEVPLSEAGRYGILSADETGRIHGFEEKPKNPASNLASMGVYIFDWAELRKYLIDDENSPASGNDFGHDVIPAMLRDGRGVYAYRFEGYWKDVGTVQSLWEANMDLLGASPELDLDDDSWRIYSRHIDLPPQVISPTAEITNSAVTEGCIVAGRVDNSVLFSGVTIEEGAVVSDSIIMPFSVVKKGAVVKKGVIADGCVIGENAQIGAQAPNVVHRRDPLCADGLTLVAEGVKIGPGVKVGPGVSVLADISSADAATE